MVLVRVWDAGPYYYSIYSGSRVGPLHIKGNYIQVAVETEKAKEGEYMLSFIDGCFYFIVDGNKFLLSRINDEPDNYYIELQMTFNDDGEELTSLYTWNAIIH